VQPAEATPNPVDERTTKKKTIKALGRRRGSREPASQAAQGTASLLHSRKPQRTQSKATASPPRLAIPLQPTTTGYHYWLNGEREKMREREGEREKERERVRNSSNDCRASRERERERESEREKERERKKEREREREGEREEQQ
jgi:hypothetical protein